MSTYNVMSHQLKDELVLLLIYTGQLGWAINN